MRWYSIFLQFRKIHVNEEESRLPALKSGGRSALPSLPTTRSAQVVLPGWMLHIILRVSIPVLLFAAMPAQADDVLTLELPPSAEAVAQRAADRARQAADRIPEAPKTRTATTSRRQSIGSRTPNRAEFASRGQSGDSDRVVGRLGQVDRATPIYRSQSSRAARLSSAPAGTFLAIQTESGNWYGILMSDGSLGWLRRQAVRLLDYQVVSNGALSQPQQSNVPLGEYSDGLPAGRSIYFRGDPQALFREAYRYLGIPYHFGGNAVSGIDCSAFVMDVFASCGYPLPRHSSDQTAYGLAVPKDQLQPGDRLYFGNAATRNISHTGLYIGNGYFIHASSNSRAVAISHLREPLYERIYICARR